MAATTLRECLARCHPPRVHNIIVPVVLDPVTADTGITEYVVGEFGLGLAIAWGIVGYICRRLRHSLPRVYLSADGSATSTRRSCGM